MQPANRKRKRNIETGAQKKLGKNEHGRFFDDTGPYDFIPKRKKREFNSNAESRFRRTSTRLSQNSVQPPK